ncbi:hypothetical protein [Pontimicrobium sp. MEBiC01747]
MIWLYKEKDKIKSFGIDKNDDGTYNEYNEPTIIKKYNLESGILTDIIDKKILLELQKTLEGTKK